MRVIDQAALRIGLVCDEQNKLLGTVTDGDIRRALLREANMTDAVSAVMNSKPIVAKQNSQREQRLQLMKQHDLTAILLWMAW